MVDLRRSARLADKPLDAFGLVAVLRAQNFQRDLPVQPGFMGGKHGADPADPDGGKPVVVLNPVSRRNAERAAQLLRRKHGFAGRAVNQGLLVVIPFRRLIFVVLVHVFCRYSFCPARISRTPFEKSSKYSAPAAFSSRMVFAPSHLKSAGST